MTLDPSTRADHIIEQAKAHRPHWRSPWKVPAWFSGDELDVLTPAERGQLYRELRSRLQVVQWLPFVLAMANASQAVRDLHSANTRLLWMAVAAGFALVAIGAWWYRRQSILRAARRQVRESADWPIRLARQNA
jgi:hypothetical protein